MYKVTWLCTYPVSKLAPELKLSKKTSGHAASWVVNLSNRNDIKLKIITHSSAISFSQEIRKNNITFHVIKYTSAIKTIL